MNILEGTTATILSMLSTVAVVGSMTKITSNLMSLLRFGATATAMASMDCHAMISSLPIHCHRWLARTCYQVLGYN